VKEIAANTLRKGYSYIDTVGELTFVYKYINIYIYIYVYICIHTYICLYIHTYINMYTYVSIGEQAEQTHAHVSQNIMPVPVGQQIRALSMILEQQMNSNPNYKIMVFFPTARQTGMYIYICIYVYVYIYIHICICLYINIYIYIYIHIFISTYMCVCIYTYIFINAYTFVHIYVYIYIQDIWPNCLTLSELSV
jgi:hypothetical protein